MKKKKVNYPVIEIPNDGKNGWGQGAFTIAFLYSKKGNFVIKGYLREVKKYIKENFTHYFVNYSLWHSGIQRNIWYFWKKSVTIYTPEPDSKIIGKWRNKYKWKIEQSSGIYMDDKGLSIELKRMPKRWIKEFEQF